MSSMVEYFRNLPCYRLSLACGDSVLIALQGAQVLSWVSQGRERLFLSPNNKFDGHTPIRGGVPICFPQFNQRGPLPRHGFVRTMEWDAHDRVESPDIAFQDFSCATQAHTLAHWEFQFVAQYRVEIEPGQLNLTLRVTNNDSNTLQFTGALHTYLAVDDIALTELRGLDGLPEWDAVEDVHAIATPSLHFDGEFDRVYHAGDNALHLQDGSSLLQIEQSPNWAHTVVWNPGAEKSVELPDLPDDGFARMLCVEAAQVFETVHLEPQEEWQGWQRLRVVG